MLRAVVLIALMLAAVGGCGRRSEDLEQISRDQREILFRLGALAKAIQQAGSQAPSAADLGKQPPKAYEITLGESPAKGPRNAPVTIVEFSDFQCPGCKTYQGLVNQVLQLYPNDVKLVYKQFPLADIHDNAVNAAKAALAAGRQGKFWEMHDMLYENQKAWHDAFDVRSIFEGYATRIGLDLERFKKDNTNEIVELRIFLDGKRGHSLDVKGTPTVFLNGREVPFDSLAIDKFRALINAALASPRP